MDDSRDHNDENDGEMEVERQQHGHVATVTPSSLRVHPLIALMAPRT
jgi:hypothetical protein